MVNEEDHLRLQSLCRGSCWARRGALADQADDELDGSLEYAYHDEWGYLTACPTNVGTGMRASVLIHLPALVLTKQIDKVLKGVTQMGLAVRGFYGEGTDVMGNLFQISNQTTLGQQREGKPGEPGARHAPDPRLRGTGARSPAARRQGADRGQGLSSVWAPCATGVPCRARKS